jgi:hypothetical protein
MREILIPEICITLKITNLKKVRRAGELSLKSHYSALFHQSSNWNRSLHRASTAKRFTTPGQGSPSLAADMGIEHPSWPKQACNLVQTCNRCRGGGRCYE